MPLFTWLGWDGPDSAERRAEQRPAHLAGLERLAAADRIRHAGPLLDPTGKPVGSVVLFEAESLAEARAVAAGDAYVTGRVFARHSVHETRQVLPREGSGDT